MVKDWKIWLTCICLFWAGAIWAQIPIGTDFFVTRDVHDFLECVAAVATVVAVILAWIGVDSWRKQIRASTDHELARRMLIAVHSLGESIVEAWVWVSIANTEIQVKGEKLNVNELRAISQGVEGPRKRLGEARNIIKSISVECRAIWGERQESAIRELLELSEVCSNYLSSYMAICSTDTDMVERSIRSVVLQRIWAELDDKKLYSHPNVLSYVERYVSSYSERLKDKFLD